MRFVSIKVFDIDLNGFIESPFRIQNVSLSITNLLENTLTKSTRIKSLSERLSS